AAPISISGGQYSIDAGVFTAAAGEIRGGQQVQVRRASAANPGSDRFATLTIGTISSTFRVTTLQQDTVPEPFNFIDLYEQALDTDILSNEITVSGINTSTPISIEDGRYRINGGEWQSDNGQVHAGDSITVQLRSATTLATA